MNFPARYKADIVSAVESIDIDEIFNVIELFKQTRVHGRNIFICANTSSGCTASRVVSDLMTRSSFGKPARFRVVPLQNGPTELSDEDELPLGPHSFVEQLKSFVEPHDVVVGISATGNALPIVRALDYSTSSGCKTVALTGLDGGKLGALADITVHVASTHLRTVEDTHVIICHMIGSYFLEFESV
jgi:D-sedoheptulose 7-phosphate isomerase